MWFAHAAICFLACESRVTLCLTTQMLLRTLSYSKWSCGMLVSHSVCGWCSGSNKSCGWSRLMVGRWSFKSLYCCSSFLLVRACRFLPTEQRISLARACLRGPLSPFFISSLHLFPSRTAAFFFFFHFSSSWVMLWSFYHMSKVSPNPKKVVCPDLPTAAGGRSAAFCQVTQDRDCDSSPLWAATFTFFFFFKVCRL